MESEGQNRAGSCRMADEMCVARVFSRFFTESSETPTLRITYRNEITQASSIIMESVFAHFLPDLE